MDISDSFCSTFLKCRKIQKVRYKTLKNTPSTFQRTFLEKNLVYGFKKFSSPSNGQFLNELAGAVKNIFLLYNGQSMAVCPENFEKRKPPTN